MTTTPRTLITPTFDLQTAKVRATTRATHGGTLATLTSDAAGGHLGQCARVFFSPGGTHNLIYWSRNGVKYLAVRALLGPIGAYTITHHLTLDLSARDQTGNTVASSSTAIPSGIKADVQYHLPGNSFSDRWRNSSGLEWWLSVDELVSAGLVIGEVWVVELVISTSGSSIGVENFQITEVPRFAVDSTEDFGQPLTDFLPRGVIVDGSPSGLQRLNESVVWGYENVFRTYHHRSYPHGSPLTTTSATFTAMTGDVESGSNPKKWIVRPRRLRGQSTSGCRVQWATFYKTSGASGGTLRLNSGGFGGPYDLVLAGTSGTWALSNVAQAYLDTSAGEGLDTITFQAKVTAGTLSVATIGVVDDPE